MNNAAKNYILSLRGVKPDDLKNEEVKVLRDVTMYDDLPKHFTSVDTWIKSTNLRCWNCGRVPTGVPKFRPKNPSTVGGNLVCDVNGIFDTWNCVVSKMMQDTPINSQWDEMELICLVEALFSGKRKQSIPAAIDKTKLREYCGMGGMTHEQYDALLKVINSEF